MAFFPEPDAETTSGAHRTMTNDQQDGAGGRPELGERVIEAADNVATFLEPFLQILTAVVQAFTVWQLARQA